MRIERSDFLVPQSPSHNPMSRKNCVRLSKQQQQQQQKQKRWQQDIYYPPTVHLLWVAFPA